MKIINYIFALLALTSLLSCKKNGPLNDPSSTTAYVLHINEAKTIANQYKQRSSNLKSSARRLDNINSSEDIAQKIHLVNDANGNVLYYIVNYPNGGFVLLSGDKRIEPILAFSEDGSFPLNQEYPEGLQEWMFHTKEMITQIRKNGSVQEESIAKLWSDNVLADLGTADDSSIVVQVDSGGFPPVCQRQRDFIRGPLVSSLWGQGSPYNAALPDMGCSAALNFRPLTGCVATAVSQIMHYHRYPVNYSWASMPLNTADHAAATVMLHVGEAVDMDWGCTASGANTTTAVPNAFKNNFGYQSAQYKDIIYMTDFTTTINTEIAQNRPVIMRGGRNNNGNYVDGHAWICDGTWSSYYYNLQTCQIEHQGHLYHMNWGWEGLFNGWFVYGQNPGNNNFSYKQGMVYNIKP